MNYVLALRAVAASPLCSLLSLFLFFAHLVPSLSRALSSQRFHLTRRITTRNLVHVIFYGTFYRTCTFHDSIRAYQRQYLAPYATVGYRSRRDFAYVQLLIASNALATFERYIACITELCAISSPCRNEDKRGRRREEEGSIYLLCSSGARESPLSDFRELKIQTRDIGAY